MWNCCLSLDNDGKNASKDVDASTTAATGRKLELRNTRRPRSAFFGGYPAQGRAAAARFERKIRRKPGFSIGAFLGA